MPCTTISSSSSLPAVCTGRVIVFEHAQYASQYLVGEVTHTSLPTITTSEANLLTVHACLTCSPVASTAGTTTDMHSDTIMTVAQPAQQDTMDKGREEEERHKTHDAGAEDTSNIDRQHNNNNKADVPRIVLRCRPLRGSQASTSSAVQPAQDDLHELHSRRTSLLHDMATSQARMAQIHATLAKLRAIPSSQQVTVHSATDIYTGTEGEVQGSDTNTVHETNRHHATSSSNSCAMQEPGQPDSAVVMNAAAVNESVRPASVSCETLSSVTAASPVTTTTAGRVTMTMSTLAEADTSILTIPISATVNTAKAQLRQARAALHSVPACDWADLRRQFHPSPALQSLIETVLLVLSLSRGESGTQVQYGRIWQLKDLPQRLQHVSAKALRHRTPHSNTHTTTTTSNSNSKTSDCAAVHTLRIADIVRDCVQAERTRRALHDHVTARPLYQWLCALLAVYMADEEQEGEEREREGRHVREYSMRAESVASQSGMSDLCASSLRSATYRSSLRRSTKDDKKIEGGVCHDHNNYNNNSDTGLTHVVEAAPCVASRSPSAVAPDSQPIATHHNIIESSNHTLGGVGALQQQREEEERQDMMSCARLEKELQEHSDYVALAEEELHELDELIAQLTQALTDTPSQATTTTTTTTRRSAEAATHAAYRSSSSSNSGDMPCVTGVSAKDAASCSNVVGVVLQIGPGQVCGVLSDTAGRALMRYVTTTSTTSLVQQQQSAKDSEFIVPQHTHERSSNDRCEDDDVAAAFDELTAIVARHIMSAAASDNSVQPDSHRGEYADKAYTQHNNTTTTIGEAVAVRDAMVGETHTLAAARTQADSTATTTEEQMEEDVQRTTTTAVALSLPSAPPIRLSTSATVTNNGTTTTISPLPSALRGALTHTEGHTNGYHHVHSRKSNSQGGVPASHSSCSRPASRPGSRASSQHSHATQQRSSEKIKTKADTSSYSHMGSSNDKNHSLAKASEERTMRLLLQEELHASHAELRRLRAERDKLRAHLHRRRHYYNNNTTTSTSPTTNANEEDVVSGAVVARGKGASRRQKRQQYNDKAVGVTSATLDTDNNAQKEEEETAGAAVSCVTGQRAAKDNTEYNKTHSSTASSSSSDDDDDDSAWERLQAELKAAYACIAQLEQQQKMKEVAAKDKANGTVTSAAASADATTTTMTGKGSTEAANNTTPSAAGVGQMLLYSPAEALAAQQRLTEQVSALQAVVQQHECRAYSLEVDLNAALHRCTAAEQTIQRQRRELAAVWAQLGSTSSSSNNVTSQSVQLPSTTTTTTTTTTDTQLPSTSLINDADAVHASSPASLLLPQHTVSSSATDAKAECPCAQQPFTASPAAREAHEDHTAPSTHTNTVVPPPSRLDTSSLSSITQSEDMSTMTGATQMTLGTTTTTTTTTNAAMNTRHRPAMQHPTRPAVTTTKNNNNKDNIVTSAAMASSLVSSFATITTTHNNNSNGVSYRHDCFALPPTGPAVEPMTPLELRHEVYRLRQELERYYVEGLRYKTALQTLRERQHEERRRRSEMRVVRYSVLQNLQESINNIVQKQDQDMRQVAQLLEHSREELSMSTPSRMGSA